VGVTNIESDVAPTVGTLLGINTRTQAQASYNVVHIEHGFTVRRSALPLCQPPSSHPLSTSRRVMSVMSRSLTDTSSFSSESSPYSLQSVFDVALEAYEKKTKSKLLTHPLAAQIQSCNSSSAVYSVLHDLIQKFDRRRSSDERLSNWLKPTVNVLCAISVTLAQGVSLLSRLFS
jgi:hypothetical protein